MSSNYIKGGNYTKIDISVIEIDSFECNDSDGNLFMKKTNTTLLDFSKTGPGDTTHDIIAASSSGNTVTVSGDQTSTFTAGSYFKIGGSTGNNGDYEVISSSVPVSDTVIVVASIVDDTADGIIRIASGRTSASGWSTGAAIGTYALYAIKGSELENVVACQDGVSFALPTGYTHYRVIGCVKTYVDDPGGSPVRTIADVIISGEFNTRKYIIKIDDADLGAECKAADAVTDTSYPPTSFNIIASQDHAPRNVTTEIFIEAIASAGGRVILYQHAVASALDGATILKVPAGESLHQWIPVKLNTVSPFLSLWYYTESTGNLTVFCTGFTVEL